MAQFAFNNRRGEHSCVRWVLESHAITMDLPSANSTARPTGWQFRESIISTVLASLLAAAVLLPLLNRKILANWDEAIYAEVAREFLGRNWLIPMWQFQPWLEKPPLSMWVTALFFHFFGATQFWARATSAFAGIGVVTLQHWIALRLRGLSTAWISTLVLLSTLGFLRASRRGELDVLLALGCYAALWGLVQVRQGNPHGWYLFWIGFAFAAMTKGAASVTLILTAVILAAWNKWIWQDLRRPFVLGALLFAALVLPWHIYMLHIFGRSFLREYLGLHVITRATRQIAGGAHPWWFYGEVLLARAAPWVLLFPFAMARARRNRELREYFVFVLVVLCFFTAVATRLPKYIVPAYPALALICGDMLAARMKQRSRSVWAGFILISMALFCIASAATRELRESLTDTITAKGVVLHKSCEDRDLLLAALRKPAAGDVSGPVLLWQQDVVMQMQALLFYVHKPMQQVYVAAYPADAAKAAHRYTNPKPLADFVTASPRLILLDRSSLPSLPAGMQFDPMVQGPTLAVGTIRLRLPSNPGDAAR